MAGYSNILFNGKSFRNAILTRLSEDKHLTSALFANSNIAILVDILSYMYQTLMANLRQAASESMWSDTMFFENIARLSKMIGYYARGQNPYTMVARLTGNTTDCIDFGSVSMGYGPYHYDFAVVEHNLDNDQQLIRLALGRWETMTFVSDGSKFQEFIVQTNVDDENNAYISQKYARVLCKTPEGKVMEFKYSPDPLFMRQNREYTDLDPGDANLSRTATVDPNETDEVKFFNFYIDENANYVLKFGDGLSTAIPPKGSTIYVFYVTSNETSKTITDVVKTAMANATQASINRGIEETLYDVLGLNGNATENMTCIPVSTLEGYRDKDTPETVRQNSHAAFSRQNRLVTKQDYHDYVLENYSNFKDVTVQNNWEYISEFYGWLYNINPDLVNVNNLEAFNSSDPADANNIYIWVLDETDVAADMPNGPENDGVRVGIIGDMTTGTNKTNGYSIGAIKDITEHPIFLHALCKRFVPYAANDLSIIQYQSPNPFTPDKYVSYIRVHVDMNYANQINVIKSRTYSYVKSYLFDDIKLGVTPNIPALIKDLMSIPGVTNITTVFNKIDSNDAEYSMATEKEVNGIRFVTWTDTNNQLISQDENSANNDAAVAFNLPNIPNFQYFKSAQSYDDFITYSLKFKVDYTI